MAWSSFYEKRYLAKQDGGLPRSRSLRAGEHARLDQTIRSLYDVRGDTRVLDVGAGYASYLSSAETTALDISAAALEQSPRLHRVVGSADDLPFEDASFDVVVCSQVLEHLTNWHLALREMVRVLRTGGLLFVAVPNRYALMKRRYHEVERIIDRSGHLNEFREAELQFTLMEFGLRNIASQGACYDLFWLGSVAERSRLGRIAVAVLDAIPSSLLGRALSIETSAKRRRLNGMSLEIWGYK